MKQQIGNYYLTQDIDLAFGLEEFSEEEYHIAEQVGMKRIFEDEKMFNGVNAEFAQIVWESTTIGSTKGQIYKIALQIVSTDDKLRAKLILDTVLKFMNREIGKYNEHPSHSDKYFWDTTEGNIILDKQSLSNVHIVQIIFTSNLIRNQATGNIVNQAAINLKQSKQKQKSLTNQSILFNQNNYSDEENFRWCLLRGTEWGDWPLFVTQPIVPFLLLYFQWWHIIFTMIALTWFWKLICYKYVNVLFASLGAFFVASKWFTSIGMGIYFLANGQYFLAIFCSLYPLVLLVMMFLVPPTKIGVLQNMFINKLGYEKV
jgi:hypothetical protein